MRVHIMNKSQQKKKKQIIFSWFVKSQEILHSEKKKDLIVETVLVDQLSRYNAVYCQLQFNHCFLNRYLSTSIHPAYVHYLVQLIFFSDTVLHVIIPFFYIFRAAVSDPEKNNSTIPPDVGPKQRKQMEFYNTRYAIVVKTN